VIQVPDPERPSAKRTDVDEIMSPSSANKSNWSDVVKPLPKVLNWLENHKITVTFLSFVFLILKVMVVAKGDIPTALGILQTAGLVTIVVGALLSGLPLLAAAILIAQVYRAVDEPSRKAWMLTAPVLLLCIFLTPWTLLLASLIAGAALVRTRNHKSRVALASIAIILVTGIAAWTVLYSVWLPHEMVTLKKGASTVGYVLDDNGNWISILRSGKRDIVRYREADVEKRILCVPASRHLSQIARESTWYWLASPIKAIIPISEPEC
jgi:hypothetical protein